MKSIGFDLNKFIPITFTIFLIGFLFIILFIFIFISSFVKEPIFEFSFNGNIPLEFRQ